MSSGAGPLMTSFGMANSRREPAGAGRSGYHRIYFTDWCDLEPTCQSLVLSQL
jgi:hypothetical protein